MRRSVLVVMLVLWPLVSPWAASPKDIDRLTSYAVLFGRGAACGLDTSIAAEEIGLWMDQRFPPGSSDQQTYLPIFASGTEYYARMQAEGKSPDSCAAVRRSFAKMRWLRD